VLRKGLLIALLVAVAIPVMAADEDSTFTGWKKTLVVDITTTQTSYSDSWEGGEAGSVNWVSNLNGTAEKRLKEWFDLRSTLKLSFGQTMTQDAETKDWTKPRKSTDLIDWETVGLFGHQAYIEPYVAFRLESQFVDASVEAKKRYLSPLKLTESGGVARKFFEQDKDLIMSRFGLALRQTMATLIEDSVTLATTRETIADGGLESVTDVVFQFNEKLMYIGKLTLFKALFSENDATDDWQAVDVNWENTVSARLTKIVTVNLYTQLLYDKEVVDRGRFKETLGIGFVFDLQ
jgi:hypothetical protein